jgi:hypothetical protein
MSDLHQQQFEYTIRACVTQTGEFVIQAAGSQQAVEKLRRSAYERFEACEILDWEITGEPKLNEGVVIVSAEESK